MRRRNDPARERRLHRGPSPEWRGNRVFYVAVEGELTEPDYLAYLSRNFGPERQFIIHPLYKRNRLTPTQVVARALEQREELQGNDGRSGQLWALFDRDQHSDIPEAMRQARAGAVRVAFSHPSFDLWLLLHFSEVSGQQRGSSRIVHRKLRAYPGFEAFGAASDKSVSGSRAEALTGNHVVAIRRAKRLVDDCPTGACSSETGHARYCDPLRRDPSTDVWQLLVELGIATS